MKKYFVIIILVTGYSTCWSLASSGFGLGLMVGEPTGLSAKYWLNSSMAIDGGLAWSFTSDRYHPHKGYWERGGHLHIHGDILWHKFDLIPITVGQLPVYFGGGARIRIEDSPRLGVRGNFGLAYIFQKVSLDIFLELSPVFDIVPQPDFGIGGALGVRYFF
jgi:hypothetical protein